MAQLNINGSVGAITGKESKYSQKWLETIFSNQTEEFKKLILSPCKEHSGHLLNDADKVVNFLLKNTHKSLVIIGDYDAGAKRS